VFRIGDTVVSREVMRGQSSVDVMVRYDLVAGAGEVALTLRPLLAYRGVHDLATENAYLDPSVSLRHDGFQVRPYRTMPPLAIQAWPQPETAPRPLWYRGFRYLVEESRGYPGREDLFSPGALRVTLAPRRPVFVRAGIVAAVAPLASLWEAEAARRDCLRDRDRAWSAAVGTSRLERMALGWLVPAGRQFLIRRAQGQPAVVAGYPWFEPWGRDTLIALPGLTFCQGDMDTGRDVLVEMGRCERHGLLPNFFAADGRPGAYNTVDAPLWYVWAVQQYARFGGDPVTIRDHLWPVIERIMRAFVSGTDYQIFMAQNGLLHAGDATTQLTWMDALVNGRPVTPRSGFAVEINALWYNALCAAAGFAHSLGGDAAGYRRLADRCRQAFVDTFWVSRWEYLGDTFAGDRLDTSVRPNQIFAVSLPHSPLTPERWAGVVRRVEQELLTPFGLRTLSQRGSDYRGTYSGDTESRDHAYHQGTVWPWLLGHYAEAALRASPDPATTRRRLVRYLTPLLLRHPRDGGVATVSEVFDGDPPHRPGGCVAQAWSVAELIRFLGLGSPGKDTPLPLEHVPVTRC
jgi:predicted glycogen debranching enzyme